MPVAGNLRNLDTGPATFGAPMTGRHIGPAPYIPGQAAGGTAIGCTPFTAGSMTNKIALIQRGTCEFGVKVLNAQNAGAIGALVAIAIGGGIVWLKALVH